MPDAAPLADQLLELQVRWVVDELTGPALPSLVARDVDDLLRIAGTLRLEDVVDRDALVCSVRRLVETATDSPLLFDAMTTAAAAVYDLPAASEHTLGDVVDRAAVEALVGAVLGLSRFYDRLNERTAQSPLVSALAGRFVARLVGDVLQQNRQLAEKVPGVSSLFSLGLGAATKVRSLTVDQLLPGAGDKGAQFAIRRTNGAARDLLRDPSMKAAVMQVWDLQAAEPIAALREYLTGEEVSELLAALRELVAAAGGTDYVAAVVEKVVDAVLDRHGGTDLATLLTEAGVERDELVHHVGAHVATAIRALHERDELAPLVRRRLEPFFARAEVRALLA